MLILASQKNCQDPRQRSLINDRSLLVRFHLTLFNLQGTLDFRGPLGYHAHLSLSRPFLSFFAFFSDFVDEGGNTCRINVYPTGHLACFIISVVI